MMTTSSFRSTFSSVPMITSVSKGLGLRHGWFLHMRREHAQTLPKHAVERRERVNHVGQGLDRRAQLDRENELPQDLAGTRAHDRRADESSALAVRDQLERAPVKVVDVPSRGLGGI